MNALVRKEINSCYCDDSERKNGDTFLIGMTNEIWGVLGQRELVPSRPIIVIIWLRKWVQVYNRPNHLTS